MACLVVGDMAPVVPSIQSFPVQLPVSLRLSPLPVQSGYPTLGQQQQQAEAVALYPELLNDQDKHKYDVRMPAGKDVYDSDGASSPTPREPHVKLGNNCWHSVAQQELQARSASTSPMTVVIQPAQNVVLTKKSTHTSEHDGLPVAMSSHGSPMSAICDSPPERQGLASLFSSLPGSASEEPRCCSPSQASSPRSLGQKRSREEAEAVNTTADSPPSRMHCEAIGNDPPRFTSEASAQNAKRLRARLPCIDQYVMLRKDLDVLLSAVAGGLSAQQGMVVAAALKELAARSNKLCFKAGLDYAPECAISHTRLLRLEKVASQVQRRKAKGSGQPKCCAGPHPRGSSPCHSPRCGTPTCKSNHQPAADLMEEDGQPQEPSSAEVEGKGMQQLQLQSRKGLDLDADDGSPSTPDRAPEADTFGPSHSASGTPSPLGSTSSFVKDSSMQTPPEAVAAAVGKLTLDAKSNEVVRALLNQPAMLQLAMALEAEKRAQLQELAVVSLVHYSIHQKVGAQCHCAPCARLHSLFTHTCDEEDKGNCASCRVLWLLLQMHSRQCTASACAVPYCCSLQRQTRG
eukprot:jgi/Botrbrau1/8893/Bobra.0148s0013.2